MQRFFLALYATTPAALIVVVFVHLWAPSGLPALAQRPVWAVWALIGVWLVMSTVTAWSLRTVALWRASLGGAGALLVMAGLLGQLMHSAQAPAMLASMVAVGLAWVGIAAFIGPHRVQAPRNKVVRYASTAAAALRSATPTRLAPARHRRRAQGWHCGARLRVPAHLPFWLSGVLALESFRLAHIVATEPARSSGMLGLLLAFFVALPAATLRVWAPRTAMLLWALAALAYGGLAAKAGVWQWGLAAATCTLAACAPLLQRSRQAQHRRLLARCDAPTHAHADSSSAHSAHSAQTSHCDADSHSAGPVKAQAQGPARRPPQAV